MKLAFVVPWYGRSIPGGAEALAYQTAVHLKQAGLEVIVLTTCIRDLHADWGRNYHKPGVTVEDGVAVHRFGVKRRNRQAFDQLNWRLMQGQPISAEEERIFNEEMFRCPDLYRAIRQHQHDHLFFFIPYMFPTTYFGAQICPRRSAMIPCLHDESYARLAIHRQVVPQVSALLFNSEAEQALATALFPPSPGQIHRVVGVGVETDWQGDGARFRAKYGLGQRPLLLYAGRREPGKNTPLLLQYWQRYVVEYGRDAALVLLGAGDVAIPPTLQDVVIDLGFVPLQDKYDAYAAADLFCMPSVHESFSIVIMESWLAGTPVLVHGDCAVTREHVQKANGGLYFQDYAEFATAVQYLFTRPQLAARLGQQGRQHVLNHYNWPAVITRYKEVIAQMVDQL